MTKLKPCPFCRESPVRNSTLGDYACYVHPYNGCFLECCVISPEKFEKWNTRKGEPGRCCTNCKHWKDYWDNGSDDDDDYGNGDCDHFKQTTAYDEYCAFWEMKE